MRIAVFGAGAMGSVYAARFAEAGHEVVAVDPWVEHVAAIRRDGLDIEGPDGRRTVRGIVATTDSAEAAGAGLFVIATKAAHVAGAARAIAPLVGPGAVVLTIQNGLGAGARIAEAMPGVTVMLGVADGFGASVAGPGRVHHNAMKLIRLGEIAGGLTERLGRIEALWQVAGFTVKAFADIHALVWEKLLCNVTLSAPCTVFDCDVGTLRADPALWSVALGAMREAHACGLAEGIAFSVGDPEDYVTRFAEMMPAASPSMRLDHQAGRPSEIDFINGAIPPIGARHGIATPYNETLSAAVRRRESGFAAGAAGR